MNAHTPFPRRGFLKLSGLTAAGIASNGLGWGRVDPSYFAPMKDSLTERDPRAVYRGNDLKYIGMPVGGICAGQVYLGGDGRLWLWDIFNRIKLGIVAKRVHYRGADFLADGGANYIEPPEQIHPFAQGFALRVDGKTRTLDASGWKDVSFCGEYPIGTVEYSDPDSPVAVTLEAFSPFVPLDDEESGLPAVTLRYRVKNRSSSPKKVQIGGWVENPVGLHSFQDSTGTRVNSGAANRVSYRLDLPEDKGPDRPVIPFETWDRDDFANWTVEGDAFAEGPITIPATPDRPAGRAVKTFRMLPGDTNLTADARKGKLTSHEFTIERRFIEMGVSGGMHPETINVRLIVDGRVVRRATGKQSDQLMLTAFDVREFEGRKARLELVDDEAGLWGQLGVGPISFLDRPTVSLEESPDFGDMTLALIDGEGRAVHDLGSDPLVSLFGTGDQSSVVAPLPAMPKSGLVHEVTIPAGAEGEVTFAITWRFPNLVLGGLGKVGNYYAARFASSNAVVDHLERNWKTLDATTRAWRDAWYDSTLPRWFLDRVMVGTGVLASMTVHRFADGRFYSWEGVGGCEGTCGHVWGYAQNMARFFPRLERTRREDVDYGICFDEKTGIIPFRSEFGFGYAADSQAGYILRTYREHQMSPDDGFLRRIYPRMKKALEYLISQDGDSNGVLEGRQHNTLDVDLYGPSSWLTSYYLAALRAGEEMAKETGDQAFAQLCRTIFEKGANGFEARFWNGEYFIHRLPADAPADSMRIGNGCEADQIMGQWWAHQVGLGRVAGAAKIRAALKALHRNNLRSDIGPYRETYKPGRWYAMPGEPGLIMCTYPKGDREAIFGQAPSWATMYFNECWTGQEHQVGGHMIHEGLVEEGLSVIRAVHDRHHPRLRNPYNEVEYSDHYARSMAVYGAYIAASGYEHHGPKGHLGFAPKLTPDDFQAAFTAAEGWGTYHQKSGDRFEAGIRIRRGSLSLRTLALSTSAKGTVVATVGGRKLPVTSRREGQRLMLTFAEELRVREGEELLVQVLR